MVRESTFVAPHIKLFILYENLISLKKTSYVSYNLFVYQNSVNGYYISTLGKDIADAPSTPPTYRV